MGVKKGQKTEATVRVLKLQQKFLVLYAKMGVITDVCRELDIDNSTMHRWKETHPEFKDNFYELRNMMLENEKEMIYDKYTSMALNGHWKALERKLNFHKIDIVEQNNGVKIKLNVPGVDITNFK